MTSVQLTAKKCRVVNIQERSLSAHTFMRLHKVGQDNMSSYTVLKVLSAEKMIIPLADGCTQYVTEICGN